jgi:hypothetical protein
MIGLFTFGVRALLLAGFTFGFVVLYEHGPRGFSAGVPVELKNFETFARSLANRQGTESVSPPAPAPVPPLSTSGSASQAATPAPKSSSPPSAWEKLQSTPIGEGMDLPVGATTN